MIDYQIDDEMILRDEVSDEVPSQRSQAISAMKLTTPQTPQATLSAVIP